MKARVLKKRTVALRANYSQWEEKFPKIHKQTIQGKASFYQDTEKKAITRNIFTHDAKCLYRSPLKVWSDKGCCHLEQILRLLLFSGAKY